MFPSPQAATRLLDEMCHLTVQSFTSLETSDHFQVVKMLGEGSYGKVMLAVHRKRGKLRVCFNPKPSLSGLISTEFLSFFCSDHFSLSLPSLKELQWPWSSFLVIPQISSPFCESITSPSPSAPTRPWPRPSALPSPPPHITFLPSKPASSVIYTTSLSLRYNIQYV